ncbi:unnamed protein product [Pylaiella littoralis]
MAELMSCHATLPEDAPLSSCRSGREVKVLKYGQALQAFRGIVKKSGRDPKDFALHSLPIGGSDSYKPYTVSNMEDSRRVSHTPGDKDKGVARQPGESTMWRSSNNRRAALHYRK